MTLTELNNLNQKACDEWFMRTCTAKKWCQLMTAHRPYSSIRELLDCASNYWQSMTRNDVLEALAGHPMIGDIDSLRAKYANTRSLAETEQSGMQLADDKLYARLKQLNEDYLKKHGFIFIICASGLSAQTLLSEIELRVDNRSEVEFETAATEQFRITQLRITKALCAKE